MYVQYYIAKKLNFLFLLTGNQVENRAKCHVRMYVLQEMRLTFSPRYPSYFHIHEMYCKRSLPMQDPLKPQCYMQRCSLTSPRNSGM